MFDLNVKIICHPIQGLTLTLNYLLAYPSVCTLMLNDLPIGKYLCNIGVESNGLIVMAKVMTMKSNGLTVMAKFMEVSTNYLNFAVNHKRQMICISPLNICPARHSIQHGHVDEHQHVS